MKSIFSALLLGIFLQVGTSSVSLAALTSEQRLLDFNEMVSIIQRSYAPLRWKRETVGLDWNKAVEEYRAKVQVAKSDAEFYQTLTQFLAGLKDAHVSSIAPSNYRAFLGFLCDYVGGKVLIENINTLRLPSELFPFSKGDQLIAIDGVPVETILNEVSKVTQTGNELSTKRIAAARITSRREASGLPIPKGIALITVLPKGASKPVTVSATWIITGTPLVDLDDLSRVLDGVVPNSIQTADESESLTNALKKLSMFNLSLPQGALNEWIKSGVNDIGADASMFKLPEGAQQIEGLDFTAVIYEALGKKIGILRIPSYTKKGLLNDLAQAVQEMEEKTDVLVIDQTNNPGGSVSLVSNIVSMFADKSFKDVTFEIRPSLKWLNEFININQEIADMLAANPQSLEANALKARFEYLESEVRDSIAQKRFATKPVPLDLGGQYGMIQPQPEIKYTKPILLLINEFDFSGGDAFPAIMKDNGRVTLFGARTTGAGGNVAQYGPLANSFFKFSLTESLMVRPNGQYVENLGVSPDISYTVTEEDFVNGYQNYVKAFTSEALKLVGVAAETK